jgi:hypothetical protein
MEKGRSGCAGWILDGAIEPGPQGGNDVLF